jgi:two-component system sensor histidine kinase BarA
VLVAEDNAINAKLVDSLLKHAGANIRLVTNGKLAFEAVQSQQFDIILMDIHMPEMNGVVATKMIRNLKGSSNSIPIIALTADALPEDKLKFKEAGINATIIKPIDEAQLIATIRAHINPSRVTTNSNVTPLFSSRGIRPKSIKILNKNNPATTTVNIQQDAQQAVSNPANALSDELYYMLIKELPVFRELMNAAYTEKNWEALEDVTHKLHGASSYCNVPSLKAALQILERLAKNKEAENIESALHLVYSEIDLILQSVNYD